jgi:hypothetical protein
MVFGVIRYEFVRMSYRSRQLEEFDSEVGGIVADGDHGDEVVGAEMMA